MPNRILREAILSSESVALLKPAEEVFYRRLMSIVDDYGRHEANPQLLKSKCYPLAEQMRSNDVNSWLEACKSAGLVVHYHVDGKDYLEIVKFQQQLRSKSKCPDPTPENICAADANQLKSFAHLGVSVSVSVSDIPPDQKTSAKNKFEGVSSQVVTDFTKLRKLKKAEITETAIAGITREATKAGITLEQALITCCERGWAGFKAEWYLKDQPQLALPHQTSSAAGRKL